MTCYPAARLEAAGVETLVLDETIGVTRSCGPSPRTPPRAFGTCSSGGFRQENNFHGITDFRELAPSGGRLKASWAPIDVAGVLWKVPRLAA